MEQRAKVHAARAITVLLIYTSFAALRYVVVDSQVRYETEMRSKVFTGEIVANSWDDLPKHSTETTILVVIVSVLSGLHAVWVCDIFESFAHACLILLVHFICYNITLSMQVLSLRTDDTLTGQRLWKITMLADALMYCVMVFAVMFVELKLFEMAKEDPVHKELEEGLLYEALEDKQDLEDMHMPSAFEQPELEKNARSSNKESVDAITSAKVDVVLR